MFEFVEVPSQMIGAIGPVANGTNFDWARQDFKPGLLNLNLIIDEEVYFSLLGRQTITQQNGQVVDSSGALRTAGTPPTNPSDQFNQIHLNFNQILPAASGTTAVLPGAYSIYGTATATATAPPYLIPLASGSAPIPFVVTSTNLAGTPVTAYPLMSTGVLDNDPTTNSLYSGGAIPYLYNNSLKASFVQFLTLRHGGSGYIYGYGSGSIGQNLLVPPVSTTDANAPLQTGLPADIPFHSLSYPDIDYTVMRPAALPPTTYTNPPPNNTPSFTGTAPVFYAGDPGVRNANVYTGNNTQYPPGIVVTTVGKVVTTTFSPVYPPAIPTRRLFQVPDAYNPSTFSITSVTTATTTPAPSNASEPGDPFINNVTPLIYADGPPTVVPYTYTSTGALPAYSMNFSNTMAGITLSGTVEVTPSYPNGTTTATPPSPTRRW